MKSEKDCFEKREGLILNMEYLKQNREGQIQKHDRSDSKKEGLVDRYVFHRTCYAVVLYS